MADDILNRLLGKRRLRQADESVSEAVDGTGKTALGLQLVPLVPHGRLISGTAVDVTEDPLSVQLLLFVPGYRLPQDLGGESPDRDDSP
mgnify:CR=1 FL=1